MEISQKKEVVSLFETTSSIKICSLPGYQVLKITCIVFHICCLYHALLQLLVHGISQLSFLRPALLRSYHVHDVVINLADIPVEYSYEEYAAITLNTR